MTRLASLTVDNSLMVGRPVDPKAFCQQTRVMIVAGKGGVGKTTVSAALAAMAARSGLSTLIVEVEGRSELAAIYGRAQVTLSYQPATMIDPA
ncbi:MAG: AAA family ATPase, partial [Actinomycetota bacterium]|nr:AAA family ATPase [Actinomycetota bacterium]